MNKKWLSGGISGGEIEVFRQKGSTVQISDNKKDKSRPTVDD